MKQGFFDKVILFVLFNNIEGRTSLTLPSTKRPTGSWTTTTTHRPTRGVSTTTQRYFTYRPFTAYPKHTTYDYDDQYFPKTSEPSKNVVVSIFAAFGAVIVLVVIITFIVMKHSRKRDQQRRDALFIAANEQINRNSGQLRGNPVYIVGERETETSVNWTHNNVNNSLANNQNIAQGFMQNVQPPPYSECIASDQSNKQLSAPADSAYRPPNYAITPPPLGSFKITSTHHSTTQTSFTARPFTDYSMRTTYGDHGNTDQYLSKSSEPKNVTISVVVAYAVVIVVVVCILARVIRKARKRGQQRRNGLFIEANVQISRNYEQLRGNPVYIAGERETETAIHWTHVYLNDSLAYNENIADVVMENEQPPPYSECAASGQSKKLLSVSSDFAYHPPNYSINPPPGHSTS
ncbi:unnamed protein product [Mytilus coruscus]|uniref:Uncharacterized protein n=1 Tax=Mytilus coruscus TaxID=42192 RepID=A0A6J8D744_MYTCO|nr:unnamed protein product [Mytilus coruscus]